MFLFRKWIEYYFDLKDEYTIRGFVGAPGVGKSCVLQQIINEFYEKGINVWSTRPFEHSRKISIDDLGRYSFNIDGQQGGVLILDELGIDMNNRNYKEIDKKLLEFFKLFRHYKLDIYVVSQGIDIDITVRRLINKWYILERKYIDFLFIHLKTNIVGLYEVYNTLKIVNGDWKLDYDEGNKVAQYNITKSFKQFNTFELPDYVESFETPFWYKNENIDTVVKSDYSDLPNFDQIDYSKMTKNELLSLWASNVNVKDS